MARPRGGDKTYICTDIEPDSSWEVSYPDCPNVDAHTRSPRGYLAWHAWAETMMATHVQERCSGCQMFTIWKPRP